MRIFNNNTIKVLKKQYKIYFITIFLNAFDWVRTSDVPEENGL